MPTLAQLDGGKCYVQILPDEVLVTIFEIGSTSSDDSYFPIIVSSVSSRWRQISLSAPSIWTSIHATVYDENTLLFFERSKSRPLDITIEFGNPPFSSRAHRDLSDAISANSFRIRAIIARSKTLDAFRDFAAPFNALPFPILTHLEIDSNATDCLAHHAPLFTGVKTLQSLVFPKCLACAPLGSELTHLEIRRLRCDVEEFRTIFETSPRLHTLILYKYTRYQEIQENEPFPIQAPSLHTLIITFDKEHRHYECGCLTSCLVACNLKRLEVYQTYKSASSYFCFDHHFRVYPALESLKIVDCILHAENSSFIQKLYNLTSLELLCAWYESMGENGCKGIGEGIGIAIAGLFPIAFSLDMPIESWGGPVDKPVTT
ncbi:hypothetical protein C0991_004048 [Blastosporella zonata]|nr:hypothetical protein C0991_004763 [Blastosporella zonata]KAG6851868.1 hypothetical protein C0991_005383 [Blastosporella zonata]KAG6863696.1 hypothetical protein C0991_004048 [Blastosporella zonata]